MDILDGTIYICSTEGRQFACGKKLVTISAVSSAALQSIVRIYGTLMTLIYADKREISVISVICVLFFS
jgi:hypothetical protein